ncbi:MAG: translation elongation factor Ts [bacterium]|nr:translation elongation factor Ts [bacterium]
MENKELILKLRKETGAGVMDAKNTLQQLGGDYEKAKAELMKLGLAKAAKKADREVKAGLVESYIHTGRVGALVKVSCETDFVAKTDEFQKLAKEVAMQVSAMDPENIEELLKSAYIRDSKKSIEDLVKETIAKVGENIQVAEFSRFEI